MESKSKRSQKPGSLITENRYHWWKSKPGHFLSLSAPSAPAAFRQLLQEVPTLAHPLTWWSWWGLYDAVGDHDIDDNDDDHDNDDDDEEDFPRGSHTGTSAPSQRWKSALSQLRSKAETRWIVLINNFLKQRTTPSFSSDYGKFNLMVNMLAYLGSYLKAQLPFLWVTGIVYIVSSNA